jgi:hypothetical protein
LTHLANDDMKAWKSTIHQQSAAAIEAWHTIAPEGGKVGQIDCLQFKKRKPAVWNLTLKSGPVRSVVAKQASLKEALLEDCIYRNILPDTHLPAPAYFGLLPSGDGANAWIFVEYVNGDDYSADDAMHRTLATEWLASFHATLTGIDQVAPIEDLGPRHYQRMLDGVSRTHAETPLSAEPACLSWIGSSTCWPPLPGTGSGSTGCPRDSLARWSTAASVRGTCG